MRRFAFFVLLITIAALPAYSEEVVTGIQNGSRSFDMQLTKIGNSVFDFCTYESASASQPVALSNGIAFDFIETDSKQTTAKFGIYWDLFTQEKTTIGISVTFSATEDGATDYVHTLNGSGVAVGRALVAILENGQDKDGNIHLPAVLAKYLDGQTIIGNKS